MIGCKPGTWHEFRRTNPMAIYVSGYLDSSKDLQVEAEWSYGSGLFKPTKTRTGATEFASDVQWFENEVKLASQKSPSLNLLTLSQFRETLRISWTDGAGKQQDKLIVDLIDSEMKAQTERLRADLHTPRKPSYEDQLKSMANQPIYHWHNTEAYMSTAFEQIEEMWKEQAPDVYMSFVSKLDPKTELSPQHAKAQLEAQLALKVFAKNKEACAFQVMNTVALLAQGVPVMTITYLNQLKVTCSTKTLYRFLDMWTAKQGSSNRSPVKFDEAWSEEEKWAYMYGWIQKHKLMFGVDNIDWKQKVCHLHNPQITAFMGQEQVEIHGTVAISWIMQHVELFDNIEDGDKPLYSREELKADPGLIIELTNEEQSLLEAYQLSRLEDIWREGMKRRNPKRKLPPRCFQSPTSDTQLDPSEMSVLGLWLEQSFKSTTDFINLIERMYTHVIDGVDATPGAPKPQTAWVADQAGQAGLAGATDNTNEDPEAYCDSVIAAPGLFHLIWQLGRILFKEFPEFMNELKSVADKTDGVTLPPIPLSNQNYEYRPWFDVFEVLLAHLLDSFCESLNLYRDDGKITQDQLRDGLVKVLRYVQNPEARYHHHSPSLGLDDERMLDFDALFAEAASVPAAPDPESEESADERAPHVNVPDAPVTFVSRPARDKTLKPASIADPESRDWAPRSDDDVLERNATIASLLFLLSSFRDRVRYNHASMFMPLLKKCALYANAFGSTQYATSINQFLIDMLCYVPRRTMRITMANLCARTINSAYSQAGDMHVEMTVKRARALLRLSDARGKKRTHFDRLAKSLPLLNSVEKLARQRFRVPNSNKKFKDKLDKSFRPAMRAAGSGLLRTSYQRGAVLEPRFFPRSLESQAYSKVLLEIEQNALRHTRNWTEAERRAQSDLVARLRENAEPDDFQCECGFRFPMTPNFVGCPNCRKPREG